MVDINKHASNWESSMCKILTIARTVPVQSGGGVFNKYQYNVNYTCNSVEKTGLTLELTTIEFINNVITPCNFFFFFKFSSKVSYKLQIVIMLD